MVNAGVIGYEHGGLGTRGGPGIKRVDNKGRIQGAFANGSVQVNGSGVVSDQHIEQMTITWMRSNLYAGGVPAVGQGRGQAEAQFIAVVRLHRTRLFQGLPFG